MKTKIEIFDADGRYAVEMKANDYAKEHGLIIKSASLCIYGASYPIYYLTVVFEECGE